MLARRTRIPQDVENAILDLSTQQPTLGRVRAAAEINRRGFTATPSTVRSVWQRHSLQTAAKRIMAAARPAATGHVAESSLPIPVALFVGHDRLANEFVFSATALALIGLESANGGDQSPADISHNLELTTFASMDHRWLSGADALAEAPDTTSYMPHHSDYSVFV